MANTDELSVGVADAVVLINTPRNECVDVYSHSVN